MPRSDWTRWPRSAGWCRSSKAGVPLDPHAFAEITIRALLPFPAATLTQLRTQLDTVTTGALAVTLPEDRTSGLITAFDAVATAAAGPDTAALTLALADVDRARANTVAVLNADLAAVSHRLDALHLDRALDGLATVGATLTRGEEGILEFLAELRTEVGRAHHLIDLVDVPQIQAMITAGIEMAETHAEEFIGPSVDAAVQRARAWLQGLLDHLGLAALRAEVTDFIHSIAAAVTEADLDGPVKLATETLDRLKELVSGPALANAVQAALHEVADLVGAALDGVIAALAGIRDGIEGLADQAQPILERAAAALSEFRTAIDAVVHGVDGLGIEQATTQVIGGISSLRQTAQEVLTVAPLPDALRPAVEQLIHTIEAIDLASAIEVPVKQVLDQLKIPDSFTGSLDGVVEAVGHLVPTEAIDAIQTEIGDLLEKLTTLNPGQLLSGITDLLRSVAGVLDGLDPRPAAETLSGPFKAVLAAVDAVEPTTLLKPVIDAFDQLLRAVHIPTPATGASRVTAVLAEPAKRPGRRSPPRSRTCCRRARPALSRPPRFPGRRRQAPAPRPARPFRRPQAPRPARAAPSAPICPRFTRATSSGCSVTCRTCCARPCPGSRRARPARPWRQSTGWSPHWPPTCARSRPRSGRSRTGSG